MIVGCCIAACDTGPLTSWCLVVFLFSAAACRAVTGPLFLLVRRSSSERASVRWYGPLRIWEDGREKRKRREGGAGRTYEALFSRRTRLFTPRSFTRRRARARSFDGWVTAVRGCVGCLLSRSLLLARICPRAPLPQTLLLLLLSLLLSFPRDSPRQLECGAGRKRKPRGEKFGEKTELKGISLF